MPPPIIAMLKDFWGQEQEREEGVVVPDLGPEAFDEVLTVVLDNGLCLRCRFRGLIFGLCSSTF